MESFNGATEPDNRGVENQKSEQKNEFDREASEGEKEEEIKSDRKFKCIGNEKLESKKSESKLDEEFDYEKYKEDRTCPKCFKMFFNKQSLGRHIKQEHERVGRIKCANCLKTFASKISLKYHMTNEHSEVSIIECKKCGEYCSDMKMYMNHIKSHGVDEMICEECGKTIRGKNHYKRHLPEVHDEETRLNLEKTRVMVYEYKCDECDFRTKRKYLLDYHKQRKHSQDVPSFKCENCNKTFSYRSSLNRHKKSCHKGKGEAVEEAVAAAKVPEEAAAVKVAEEADIAKAAEEIAFTKAAEEVRQGGDVSHNDLTEVTELFKK